jgi:cytochrome b561
MATLKGRYGRLSIILHWITLALLIGVYACIELREMYPRELHVTLATIGYVLIGLHGAAALFHHYVQRDNTLTRMKLSRRDP